jgi:hypothetical protein
VTDLACPVCGQPASVTTGPPRERSYGSVAALLDPGLALRCEEHGAQPLAAAAALTTARDRLPRARRCRVRRTCCAACGARLVLPARRTRRALTIEAAGLPVHTIHLDVALTRCPDCGIEQLPWSSREDLDAVLVLVYDPTDR